MPICEPDCEGKDCGDDGCDGICGECGEEELCVAGLCQEECPDIAGSWSALGLVSYDGPCYDDVEDDGLVLYWIDIAVVEEEYVVSSLELEEDEPDFYSFFDCTFDSVGCKLTCSCDDICHSEYASAVADWAGVAPFGYSGQHDVTFSVDSGVLLVEASVAADLEGSPCKYSVSVMEYGQKALCEYCAPLDMECTAGLACVGYANFPDFDFCANTCVIDDDCTDGFWCNGGICWFQEETFVQVCNEDDVWYQDACGHTVGPALECSPDAGCADGECIGAALGEIGAACVEVEDCVLGDAPACVPETEGDWPGGYCTSYCLYLDSGDCPVGSTCYGLEGEEYNLCFDNCLTAADCRPGYECVVEFNVCMPPE